MCKGDRNQPYREMGQLYDIKPHLRTVKVQINEEFACDTLDLGLNWGEKQGQRQRTRNV